MDLSKVLIIGGSGMVGSAIDFGCKPPSSALNVLSPNTIERVITEKKIQAIIHLAALNLRECEANVKNAIYTNVIGTLNVVEAAKKFELPLVYMSSGAVFSTSNPFKQFTEESIPDPHCVYGCTKHVAEMIAQTYKKSIVIRTGWLFGGYQAHHHKFVEYAINNFRAGRKVYGSIDFFGSPTYVKDLVQGMTRLLLEGRAGLYHICNHGAACGYDIAAEIAEIMGFDGNLIEGKASNEILNSGPKRSNSEILTTHKAREQRHWKKALREYLLRKGDTHESVSGIRPTSKPATPIRTACRLCASSSLSFIFNLRSSPLANEFVKTIRHQHLFPLELYRCDACLHLQLGQIINPDLLYLDYPYVSSTSATMIHHLETQIEGILSRFHFDKSHNVLEIGCNDGTCLKHLLKLGYSHVVGVDPAMNIKQRNDLPILCRFFDRECYELLLAKHGRFNLIFGFHCFAHIEDIQTVFSLLFDLLEEDGLFMMEVGYFYEVFLRKTFDTIYHEHIDYYTCTAMSAYCRSQGLVLVDAIPTSIQGGSIQFFITKSQKYDVNAERIQNLCECEVRAGLFETNILKNWHSNISNLGETLFCFLSSIVSNNKKIAGYGASAKSTTFIYHFGLNKYILEYIIDDNIYKQGLLTPGSHIPVRPPEFLDDNPVDFILILSFNFSTEIIARLQNYRDRVSIIIPFPHIQVI